jgi:ATP-dependent RNA helicase RhlE
LAWPSRCCEALADEGYETPTPIQAQAIPGVMSGKDLLGIAQTGTGKTAAFALPILHRLAENKKPAPRRSARVLVLAPTRELATQIGESFKTYGKHMGVTVAVIFGGVKYGGQMRAMAPGVDVLVATPGRLLDHLGEKSMTLEGVEILVLDEADQMLDMGFIVPIRKIIKFVPAVRQNLFFSATWPTEIEKLAAEILNPNPLKVSVTPQATTGREGEPARAVRGASPQARPAGRTVRRRQLQARHRLHPHQARRRPRGAAAWSRLGVDAASIHGDKSQGQRDARLATFKAGEVRALVATDIAAAASTSTRSATSSSSSCQRAGRPTSTGSAARPAPAPTARPWRSAPTTSEPAEGHREGDPPADPLLRPPQRPPPGRGHRRHARLRQAGARRHAEQPAAPRPSRPKRNRNHGRRQAGHRQTAAPRRVRRRQAAPSRAQPRPAGRAAAARRRRQRGGSGRTGVWSNR